MAGRNERDSEGQQLARELDTTLDPDFDGPPVVAALPILFRDETRTEQVAADIEELLRQGYGLGITIGHRDQYDYSAKRTVRLFLGSEVMFHAIGRSAEEALATIVEKPVDGDLPASPVGSSSILATLIHEGDDLAVSRLDRVVRTHALRARSTQDGIAVTLVTRRGERAQGIGGSFLGALHAVLG